MWQLKGKIAENEKKKRFSLKRHLNETPRSSYQVILEGDGWLLKGKIAKKKKRNQLKSFVLNNIRVTV